MFLGGVERRRSRSGTEPKNILSVFKSDWTNSTQTVMRPEIIIILYPFLADLPHFIQTLKKVDVQNMIPVGLIKSLYQSILCWFTRLNIFEINFFHLAPFLCQGSYKFRTIIHSDDLRFAMTFDKMV